MSNSSVVHHKELFTHIFKGDSGATNHYVTPDVAPTLGNVHDNTSIQVTIPDNSVLKSTESGNHKIPKLSPKATTAHVLPELSNTSLLSLGQLADDGYLILLNKKILKVLKNFDLILTGYCNQIDGLWDVPIPQRPLTSPPTQKLNIITNINQSTKTLVQYLHTTLFSPSKSTLLQAAHNHNLIGWPGITVDNITKYLTESPATAKGHLDQHKSNIRSTKAPSLLSDKKINFFPPKESTKIHKQNQKNIQNHNTCFNHIQNLYKSKPNNQGKNQMSNVCHNRTRHKKKFYQSGSKSNIQ